LREVKARFERAIDGTQDGLWEVDMKLGKMWPLVAPARTARLPDWRSSPISHDVLRALVHPDDLLTTDAA